MNKRYITALFVIGVTVVFFYKTFFQGFLPFPGDLLLAEYQPWRTYSFNGMVPGSIPNKAQYFDTLRQLYPWKTLVVDTMKHWQIPLWNPYNSSGSPLAANVQSAAYYPLNIVYFLLSQPIAWTVLVILQPLLSMLFTYLFCRKLQLSKLASLFSSVAYAWCMFMTVFLEYNTLGHYLYLLPLSLYILEHVLNKPDTKNQILFTLTITISAFAGHLQLFIGLLAYICLYTCVRLWSHFKKTIPIFVLMIIALAVAGIQLIPTFELLQLSARSAHSIDTLINSLLVAPYQLIMYMIPDLFGNPATRNYLLDIAYPTKAMYIGLIPLFFAFLSFTTIQKNKKVALLAIMAVSVGIFVIRNPVGVLLYKLNIPIISSSSPSNLLFLLSFSLAVLAGFGVDMFSSIRQKTTYIILILFWIIYIGAFGISKLTHTGILKNNFIYSSGMLFLLTIGIFLHTKVLKRNRIVMYGLIAITVLDLAYFFWKFNPFVPIAYVYPATSIHTWLQRHAGIARIWGYGTASIASNFATELRLYSPDGYDPLYPARYGAFIQTSDKGDIPPAFTTQTRSDATIVSGYGPTDMIDNPYRLKVLKTLGVNYILDKTENGSSELTFPSKLFVREDSFDGWSIYRYVDTNPRAFLTTSYDLFKTDREFTQKFFNPTFDPARTILLEEKPSFSSSPISEGDTARIVSYAAMRVSIVTSSKTNALLFLSDTYYPGWSVTVDGKQAHILRADYTFRAVEVPPGTHRVEFIYQPKSFYFGAISTIIGIGALIIYSLITRLRTWHH